MSPASCGHPHHETVDAGQTLEVRTGHSAQSNVLRPTDKQYETMRLMTHPEPMPHAYTNRCHRVGDTVTKSYRGPGVAARQAHEESALRACAGRLPVATVVDSQPGVLTTEYVGGTHGQELIDTGLAEAVLFTLGRLLTDLQSVDPRFLPEYDGSGVLVHHDFGPNNALLDEAAQTVLLLADWEWCTVGDRLTDLGWCEFIVRLHHPDHVGALAALWDGYGVHPRWELRQQAILARAERHRKWARTWTDACGDGNWSDRIAQVRSWKELPS